MKPLETEAPRSTGRGRLFAEFLVIVAGVLLALAFDAGWDNLQDRQIENVSLASLAIDLAEAEDGLGESARRDSVIIANADALLAFSTIPADTFFVLIRRLFDTTPVQLRLRTYDELLNTGRLQLLRDRELRLALTEFDVAARRFSGYSTQAEAQWNEIARPVLYRSVDWDGIAMVGDVWGEPGPDFEPPGPDDVIRLNSELRAAIRDRRTMVTVHRDLFGVPTVEAVRRVRALVER